MRRALERHADDVRFVRNPGREVSVTMPSFSPVQNSKSLSLTLPVDPPFGPPDLVGSSFLAISSDPGMEANTDGPCEVSLCPIRQRRMGTRCAGRWRGRLMM